MRSRRTTVIIPVCATTGRTTGGVGHFDGHLGLKDGVTTGHFLVVARACDAHEDEDDKQY